LSIWPVGMRRRQWWFCSRPACGILDGAFWVGASGGLSGRSAARLLSCVRGFYRHALRAENLIPEIRLSIIALPKLGTPAWPKVMSEADVLSAAERHRDP